MLHASAMAAVLYYCKILIVRLFFSNTRQVLHVCMWKFVWGIELIELAEKRSRASEVTLGSSTDPNLGHIQYKIKKNY
jgi:hypothetical protein